MSASADASLARSVGSASADADPTRRNSRGACWQPTAPKTLALSMDFAWAAVFPHARGESGGSLTRGCPVHEPSADEAAGADRLEDLGFIHFQEAGGFGGTGFDVGLVV